MINIFELSGGNLSGKSDFLRKKAASNGTLIPSTISESFSGLVNSSLEEVELQDRGLSTIITREEIFNKLGISKEMLDRSPQVLSGGEKARLSLACSILHEPNLVCLDNTLEQIDLSSRQELFNFLTTQFKEIFVADNCSDLIRHMEQIEVKSEPNRFHKKIKTLKCENIEFTNVKTLQNLEIKNITFSYNNMSNVLEDFCVSLEAGKVYQLNGKNGAGKSTLARILAGILPIQSGEILLNGVNIVPYDSPGNVVSFHFQDPNTQLFYSSIKAEISANAECVNPQIIADCFGLDDILDVNPWDLPISIRKRLTLASTISFDRHWYVLDEPTLFQDSNSVEQIALLINSIISSGRGVILISHNKYLLQLLRPFVIEL